MQDILSKVQYNSESPSKLCWKESVNYKIKAGDCCGSLDRSRGYWLTCYKGKKHKVHRLIWELFNGPIPDGFMIDHKIGKDNSIENLRLATAQQSNSNRRKPKSKQDSSLPKGIRFKGSPGYMEARIKLSGETYTKYSYDLGLLVTWLDSMRDSLHKEFSQR